MPGRYFTRRRQSRFPRAVINSIKNQVFISHGTSGSQTDNVLAKAVTSPSPTVNSDTSHGCIIKAIWLSLDGCGTAGSGVLNNMNFYIWKNPGNNIVPPSPVAWGTSNEKKFVFRSWKFMVMRNQDGNTPFHWEGWIRIPRIYQRMGTDDVIQLIVINTAGVTGHFSVEAIYKWYR